MVAVGRRSGAQRRRQAPRTDLSRRTFVPATDGSTPPTVVTPYRSAERRATCAACGGSAVIEQTSAAYGARVADTFGKGPGPHLAGDFKHALKSGHTVIAAAFEEAFTG